MNDNLTAALEYAARGWHVFPLRPHTKTPATAHGLNDATIERSKIVQWWTRDPTAGIAVATGPLSGIWAIDVDVSEQEDKHGDLTLHLLQTENGTLPDTLTQLTPRGGWHLIYTWDPAANIRNNQSGRIGADLDVRGDGGYICLAPTVVRYPDLGIEGAYTWDVGQPDEPVAAPQWLVDLATYTPPERAPIALGDKRTDRPGDRWAAATDWGDLLTPDGWTYLYNGRSGERRWCRPGRTGQVSATTGYTDADNLKVFTSSLTHMGLEAEQHYSKIGYLAATRHGGDHAAAASWLAANGWGSDIDDIVVGERPTAVDDTPAEPAPWPELQPLEEPPDLPPWPVHVLPAWMATHITETADQLQVPVDLCAQFALGAVAAVAMGYTEVVVGGRWREPLNLYLATALPSGGGKSPAEKAMTRPVRQWEKRQREASMTEVAEAEVRRRVLEARAKDAEKAASLGSGDIGAAIEARRVLDEHEVRHPFRRLVDDATPEKLTQILAEQRGLIAVLSTEAELLDMAAGTYGRSPNINVYLKAYSGDPIIVDRKGGSTNPATELRIDKPLLTVGLAMQPTVIDFVGNANTQLEGRGFLARFLFSCPVPTAGARDRSRVLDAPDTTAADTYNHRLTELAERWVWPVPPMTLTAEAERSFIANCQAHEAELRGRLAPVSAWMAKLESATLRVAGILHLVDGNPPDQPIDADTVARATEAGDYWIAHALAMAVDPSVHGVVVDALKILEHVERNQIVECSPRDVQIPFRKNRFPHVDDVVPALKLLESCGYLRLVEGEWSHVGVQRLKVRIQWRPRSVVDITGGDHGERSNARNARNGYGEVENHSLSLSTFPHASPKTTRVTRVIDEGAETPQPVDNFGGWF